MTSVFDCDHRPQGSQPDTPPATEQPADKEKLKAIKAIWLKWKADDVTAWTAMRDIEAIIEED